MKRLATATMIMLAISSAVRADDASDLQKLRDENTRLKARIAELETQLGIVQNEKRQLAEQAAASVSERRDYYVESDYDADANKTTLLSRATELRAPSGRAIHHHWIRLEAVAAGKPGTASPDTVLVKIETFATGTTFRNVHEIDLKTPAGTITAPITQYDSKLRYTGSTRRRIRIDDEFITAQLTFDQFKTLAAANAITGRIGVKDFVFTREQLNMSRALLDSFSLK